MSISDIVDLISNLGASLLGAIIGALSTWIFMKIQEHKDIEKANRKNKNILKFQLLEQLNLCKELQDISFQRAGALNNDLQSLKEVWKNLCDCRYNSDLALINYFNDDQLINKTFKAWQNLWAQYHKTCKSASASIANIDFEKDSPEEKETKLKSLLSSKGKLNNKIDMYKEILKRVNIK